MLETPTIESQIISLIKRDEYEVGLEFNEDFVILNISDEVKLTKSVYKDMKETLDSLLKFLSVCDFDYLWVASYKDNTSLNRLVRKVGFEEVGIQGDFLVLRKGT